MLRVRTILIGTFALMGVYYLYNSFWISPDNAALHFTYDAVLSAHQQSYLEHEYRRLHETYATTKDINKAFLITFPYIKHITTERTWNNQKRVVFCAYRPIGLTTDQQILLQDGNLYCQTLIEAQLHALMPKVHIAHKDDLIDCVQWMAEHGHTLCKQFMVTWYGKNKIVLKDPAAPLLNLLCSCTTIPSKRIYEQCQALYANNPLKLTRTKEYLCDLRFGHKIILKGIARGEL